MKKTSYLFRQIVGNGELDVELEKSSAAKRMELGMYIVFL